MQYLKLITAWLLFLPCASQAALSFVDTGACVNTTAETAEIEPPAGLLDNDLMVIGVTVGDNLTGVTIDETPAWQESYVVTTTSADATVFVATRYASSEGSNPSYTIDLNTGGVNRKITA
jgi:hypothetical protein